MRILVNRLSNITNRLGFNKGIEKFTGISNYFKNKSLANRLKNNYNNNNFELNNIRSRLKDAPKVSMSEFLAKHTNNGVKKGL